MPQLFTNNPFSTLASGISAGAGSLTLVAGGGSKFPSPAAGDFFDITLTQAGDETSWEVARCTARSDDTLTLSARGLEGTTASAWTTGDKVEVRITKGFLNGVVSGLNAAKKPIVQTLSAPGTGDLSISTVRENQVLNYVLNGGDQWEYGKLLTKGAYFGTGLKTFGGSISYYDYASFKFFCEGNSYILLALSAQIHRFDKTTGQYVDSVGAPAGNGIKDLVFNGSRILCRDGNALYTSDNDGTSWTARTFSWAATEIGVIFYAGGYFFFVSQSGTEYLYYSVDGATWGRDVTSIPPRPWHYYYMPAIGFCGGYFFACDQSNGHLWRTSAMGGTWTEYDTVYKSNPRLLTFSDHMVVAYQADNKWMVTYDGVNFSQFDAPFAPDYQNCIQYGATNPVYAHIKTSSPRTIWLTNDGIHAAYSSEIQEFSDTYRPPYFMLSDKKTAVVFSTTTNVLQTCDMSEGGAQLAKRTPIMGSGSLPINFTGETSLSCVQDGAETNSLTALGSSISSPDVPSWVRKITVTARKLKTNGTAAVMLRVKNSSGVVSSGYTGCCCTISGYTANSTGFSDASATANTLREYTYELTREGMGSAWECKYGGSFGTGAFRTGSGSIEVVLSGLVLCTANGSDIFNGGVVTFTFEG